MSVRTPVYVCCIYYVVSFMFKLYHDCVVLGKTETAGCVHDHVPASETRLSDSEVANVAASGEKPHYGVWTNLFSCMACACAYVHLCIRRS